jgi:hypothetical protein
MRPRRSSHRIGWPLIWRPYTGWPRLRSPRIGLRDALLIVALLAPLRCLAGTVELDGVQLPDTLQRDGKVLHLNGIGLRTYSILGIHIYVVGLYLEHPSTDADAIMQSDQTKLLKIRFVHNVSVNAARNAWRKGLERNCRAPCRLDPDDVARFLELIPAMHAGERYSILFTGLGATVTADGTRLGTISQPQLVATMLAMFLGPVPASARLKAELLQGHG